MRQKWDVWSEAVQVVYEWTICTRFFASILNDMSDFVACDKFTTGLRHELFRVKTTYSLS